MRVWVRTCTRGSSCTTRRWPRGWRTRRETYLWAARTSAPAPPFQTWSLNKVSQINHYIKVTGCPSVYVCVCVCLSVVKDFPNFWTKSILIYREAFHRTRENMLLFGKYSAGGPHPYPHLAVWNANVSKDYKYKKIQICFHWSRRIYWWVFLKCIF